MWGNPGLWAGWCRPDAERAWRVFLPLVAPGGTPQPWPVAASDLEAQLWWPDLAESPGIGGPALDLEPASGMVDANALAALLAALDAVAGQDAVWRHLQDEPGPPYSDVRGKLTDLARAWTTGFAGRAWCLTEAASVAAPAYADSLVVAGPARLGPELTQRGLQVAPVAPNAGHHLFVT